MAKLRFKDVPLYEMYVQAKNNTVEFEEIDIMVQEILAKEYDM